MSSDVTVGDRLRDARKRSGMSAADLGRLAAEALGRNKPISESAIRNQENGTNGVPYEAIRVYAEILGVERAWLAFGDGHSIPQKRDRAISLMPDLGSSWSPAELTFEADRAPIVRVTIPEFQQSKLFASYVSPNERMPEYLPGTLMVYCWTDEMGAREGDHVVVYRISEDDMFQSLRVVTQRGNGVFLETHPDGASKEDPIPVDAPGYIVVGVIVATYRLVPPRPGPLLVTITGTTENLLT